MIENGAHNIDFGADRFGFRDLAGISWNLGAPQLYEHALQRNEARVAAHGPLVADTGAHTGRSPKDKFVVRDANTEAAVWWDNNNAMTVEHFDALLADFIGHARGKTLFAQDLYGGADPQLRISARVFTEYAWHSLFIRNLLIRPPAEELAHFVPELTIVDLPSFRADPKRHGARSETIIACDFSRKIVLIGGTSYAGEMKKSVFTFLNYLLPTKHVMPMHCSANYGKDGDSAIFFGLSGTGKTTLSADPQRTLIGDDEHGWGRGGIFNFEGGCYAKAIKLSREAEPEIYATTERFGSVMENVDARSRVCGFPTSTMTSKTENTRIAYPLDFIANASATGRAGHPKNIIMLTCDAFGVLPPIAKLDRGAGDVSFPLRLHRQGGRARRRASPSRRRRSRPVSARHSCRCIPRFTANSCANWSRGITSIAGSSTPAGRAANLASGRRMPIRVTRRLVAAALDGSLHNARFPHRSLFRPRRASAGARRRAAHSRSDQDLAQQG